MPFNETLKKNRIVIASILKPVNETRMFEKMGQTLAEEIDVHIIGYASASTLNHPTIVLHPLKAFNRLSIERLLAPWNVFRTILHIKPTVLIVATHELLFVGVLAKLFLNCRLLYDIQENYARNILYTPAFPKLLRPLLAAYVRSCEWLSTPFVNHFLLAERSYQSELNFLGSKFTIIENKVKREQVDTKKTTRSNDGLLHLLFSGTLAETTGVFSAIELATQLHDVDQSIQLTLIGYCSQRDTLEKIRASIANKSFIQLIGGDTHVPHEVILHHIQLSNFGVIAYADNRATGGSTPTKLYEYLGHQLPILMMGNQPGGDIAKPYQAGLFFSIDALPAVALLNQMRSQVFYTTIPKDVFWESESSKLKEVIFNLPTA